MEKLHIGEEVTLPCGEKLFVDIKGKSVAVIATNANIWKDSINIFKSSLIVSKKSIKPLIEFLQRLDLTLED
jgi:hypothetical protein